MKSKPEAGDLRERALRLLARREHSRFELQRKLEAVGFDAAEIAPLLDEFEEKTWLSDRRFAESWVADHREKSGSVKLSYELKQRGVPEAIIQQVLTDTGDNELERAHAVWAKKFKASPATPAEHAKQVRFLQARGFAADLVHRIVSRPRNP